MLYIDKMHSETKEEYIERYTKYKNALKNKKQKGYHKSYLNRLRGLGCVKTRCTLCHDRPSNKSLKKRKGNHRHIYNDHKYNNYLSD